MVVCAISSGFRQRAVSESDSRVTVGDKSGHDYDKNVTLTDVRISRSRSTLHASENRSCYRIGIA